MTDVPEVNNLTADVRREIQQRWPLPVDDSRRLDVFISFAIDYVAESLATPASNTCGSAEAPPIPPTVPEEAVRDVCRLAVTKTWQAVADQAEDSAGQSDMMYLADRALSSGQSLLLAAVKSRSERRSIEDLRKAIMRALLRGDPAADLAARGGVKLAPSYVVLLFDRETGHRLEMPSGLDHRRDILYQSEEDALIVLLPAVAGTQRGELRAHCEKALRGVINARSTPIAAAASAQAHEYIPEALQETRIVLHVARTLNYANGFYQIDDVPIEASLMRSPDLAGLLALRLAPLYGSGAPLLDTLRVYLENSQDRRQAAKALYIHPNTLDYRLRRIRELTGLSPTLPRDIQTLGAAIIAWRLTGMERNS